MTQAPLARNMCTLPIESVLNMSLDEREWSRTDDHKEDGDRVLCKDVRKANDIIPTENAASPGSRQHHEPSQLQNTLA